MTNSEIEEPYRNNIIFQWLATDLNFQRKYNDYGKPLMMLPSGMGNDVGVSAEVAGVEVTKGEYIDGLEGVFEVKQFEIRSGESVFFGISNTYERSFNLTFDRNDRELSSDVLNKIVRLELPTLLKREIVNTKAEENTHEVEKEIREVEAVDPVDGMIVEVSFWQGKNYYDFSNVADFDAFCTEFDELPNVRSVSLRSSIYNKLIPPYILNFWSQNGSGDVNGGVELILPQSFSWTSELVEWCSSNQLRFNMDQRSQVNPQGIATMINRINSGAYDPPTYMV